MSTEGLVRHSILTQNTLPKILFFRIGKFCFWLVCYEPQEQFFSYQVAVTITGDRAATLDLCLALITFSSEESFTRPSINYSTGVSAICCLKRIPLRFQFYIHTNVTLKKVLRFSHETGFIKCFDAK
jgi:hypothetical protein